jgi:hypothetical protein
MLTLRVTLNKQTGLLTNDLAPDALLFLITKLESSSKTVDDVRQDKPVLDFIQDCIDRANKKAVSRV